MLPIPKNKCSSMDWKDKIKYTLSKIRKLAIKKNENKELTIAKLNAVRNHCNSDGDYAKCIYKDKITYIRIG